MGCESLGVHTRGGTGAGARGGVGVAGNVGGGRLGRVQLCATVWAGARRQGEHGTTATATTDYYGVLVGLRTARTARVSVAAAGVRVGHQTHLTTAGGRHCGSRSCSRSRGGRGQRLGRVLQQLGHIYVRAEGIIGAQRRVQRRAIEAATVTGAGASATASAAASRRVYVEAGDSRVSGDRASTAGGNGAACAFW